MADVRPATRADADDIAKVHVESWRVGYRGIVDDEVLDSEEFATNRHAWWRAWQFLPGSEVIVATDDGAIVGFASYGPERSDTDRLVARGEVYAFYLDPSAWGSGAASPMMSASEERLREMGFSHAVLWVFRDNPRARRFYEKAGWTSSGEQSFFDLAGTQLAEVRYDRRL
jgi:RimJ/RimL family protein N-acetyltransferase